MNDMSVRMPTRQLNTGELECNSRSKQEEVILKALRPGTSIKGPRWQKKAEAKDQVSGIL